MSLFQRVRWMTGIGLAALILPLAAAEGDWWLDVNVASKHIHPKRDFNEHNEGLGLTYGLSDTQAIAGGFFRNSDREQSRYLLYQYTPWAWHALHGGAVVGLIDGYPRMHSGGVFPMAALLLKVEGERLGANLLLTPPYPANDTPATLALQLKVRF